ncbi:PREDICTED: uncharacterized protein LOC109241558 [Nicotiana attenuata]|uniref:uncharacterized protein LOC109241558 n=1 Tax=Nicotiana attenuata TaxID=49451 RepID=UPI00090477D2|nr:PREDICTED: uncharacterized protein LOC109241558 [Nicotiana attenuata]
MRAPPTQCSQCGRAHSRQCRQGSNVCYTCGEPIHYMRDFPMNDRSRMVLPTISITVSSFSVRPQERGSQASTSRGRGRGGASSCGGSQNCIYALAGCQDPEATPDDMSEASWRLTHFLAEVLEVGYHLGIGDDVVDFLGPDFPLMEFLEVGFLLQPSSLAIAKAATSGSVRQGGENSAPDAQDQRGFTLIITSSIG